MRSSWPSPPGVTGWPSTLALVTGGPRKSSVNEVRSWVAVAVIVVVALSCACRGV